MNDLLIDYTYAGNHINMRVKKRITRIMDDSAAGKTYFYESLGAANARSKFVAPAFTLGESALKLKRISGSNIDDYDRDYIVKVFKAQNSVIVVDEADHIFMKYKDLFDIILNNTSSYFILMTRKYYAELPLNIYHNAKIVFNGNEITLKYYERTL